MSAAPLGVVAEPIELIKPIELIEPIEPIKPIELIEPISPDPPRPIERPQLRQRWEELAYFHWPYEPAIVQRLLPEHVTVDTFSDMAWVGLIPFEMRSIRIGPTPPVPWLGSFIEVNVRTYVRDARGRRAVWFFSLDAPRLIPVLTARTAFGLPYCWARATHEVDRDRHRYRVERRWPRRPRASADLRFTVGSKIDAPSELEDFLSARWALLAERGRSIRYGPVHHERWPLHALDEVEIDDGLVAAAGLPAPDSDPHAMYSPGVAVEVGGLEPVCSATGVRRRSLDMKNSVASAAAEP